MRAPEFWYRPDGPWPRLLAPAAGLYAAGDAIRRAVAQPATAPVPVVCVGNLVTGGAGKTPVAIALAALAREAAANPAFLTRGYGGRLAGPVQVDPAAHDFRDVGDEPLLLAASAPTWVARDRAAGAAAAAAAGADLVIMDDGFQNVGLRQNLRLLVIDGEVGFGNGRVIPAGPLREPIERGLERADAAILIEPDRHGLASGFTCPVVHARLSPAADDGAPAGRRLIAFAGIGRPEKFFRTLRDLGAEIVEAVSFGDHHAYTPREIDDLLARAKRAGAAAVTTEKDLVRVPAAVRSSVSAVPVAIVWGNPNAARNLLRPLLPHG